jgi:threonyl-tRNA synthetase
LLARASMQLTRPAQSIGMVFWHPRGWALYRVLEDYVRARMRRAGFREIRTPQLLAHSLWERSGDWDKFAAQVYALPERAINDKGVYFACEQYILRMRTL